VFYHVSHQFDDVQGKNRTTEFVGKEFDGLASLQGLFDELQEQLAGDGYGGRGSENQTGPQDDVVLPSILPNMLSLKFGPPD
jgi:hypothetical protein